MKLHENYIKALEDHYKDFSYSETIEMIKRNRLYGAASSKYTIQSLPKDRVWISDEGGYSDLNLEKFGDDAFDIMVFLTDKNDEFEYDSESIPGMWVSSKKANLTIKKWDNDDWWENEKNINKLEKIEESFQASIGEKFKGVIYNHLLDFTTLKIDEYDPSLYIDPKKIIDLIENKSDFKKLLKKREIEFEGSLQDDSSGRNYSDSSIRIQLFELEFKDKPKIETITLIKNYTGVGGIILDIEGTFGETCGYLKNTGEKNIEFLNPFNGKWENFLLQYDNEALHSYSTKYNYTHHQNDDKFDFSKDFPEEDKLNKALKLHLENIKKYGKK